MDRIAAPGPLICPEGISLTHPLLPGRKVCFFARVNRSGKFFSIKSDSY